MPGKKKKNKKGPSRNKPKGLKQQDAANQAELNEAKQWLDSLNVGEIINPVYFETGKIEEMRENFGKGIPFENITLENFLSEEYCARMMAEFKELDFFHKSTDLFEFVQSDDLNKVDLPPLLGKFREVLYSEQFRGVLESVTGIKTVSSNTDMFAAVYQNGHHLLPHDDELSDRVIAYILYLVPPGPTDEKKSSASSSSTDGPVVKKQKMNEKAPKEEERWGLEDGGTLDLYSVDENGEPAQTVVRKVPQWNSLSFFAVSEKSWHQVAEVVSKDKVRSSISGWFHGEAKQSRERYQETLPEFKAPAKSSVNIDEWIHRDYRRANAIKDIRGQFADDSSIELGGFLREDKFQELSNALKLEETKSGSLWEAVGPVSKRSYDRYVANDIVQEFITFLNSTEYAAFLAQLTGLEVSKVNTQCRRFKPGDYTVAHDTDPELAECGLDATLCCLPRQVAKKWRDNHGGSMHYLASGEEDELLRVMPKANTMSLVYRAEPGVMSFVKYVNNRAPGARVDFSSIYRVVDDSDEDEESDEE